MESQSIKYFEKDYWQTTDDNDNIDKKDIISLKRAQKELDESLNYDKLEKRDIKLIMIEIIIKNITDILTPDKPKSSEKKVWLIVL